MCFLGHGWSRRPWPRPAGWDEATPAACRATANDSPRSPAAPRRKAAEETDAVHHSHRPVRRHCCRCVSRHRLPRSGRPRDSSPLESARKARCSSGRLRPHQRAPAPDDRQASSAGLSGRSLCPPKRASNSTRYGRLRFVQRRGRLDVRPGARSRAGAVATRLATPFSVSSDAQGSGGDSGLPLRRERQLITPPRRGDRSKLWRDSPRVVAPRARA